MLINKNSDRGDTLVEVLLALTILSVVIVSSLVLMNRGQAVALNSLERSQVQNLISEQGQMLSYVRDAYADVLAGGQTPQAGTAAEIWQTIMSTYTTTPNTDVCTAAGAPNRAAGSFYLTYNTAPAANPVSITPYLGAPAATFAMPGQGLWVEAQSFSGAGVNKPYVDFFIKGCWQPSGTGANQESKNVVRLYAP